MTKKAKREVKSQPEEVHEAKVKGVWIPIKIFNLCIAGGISPTEMILLASIDSLVDPEGLGCYASNDYFAKKLKVCRTSITRMITRLTKMEHIIYSVENGRRYLETPWSRDVDPRAVRGIPYSMPRAYPTVCPVPLLRKGPYNKEENKGARVGFFETTNKHTNTITEQDQLWADKLHEIVVTNRRRRGRWSKANWCREFRILREELDQDTKRIDNAIKFYQRHVGESGVPPIDSGASFRRHFNWLEDAMKKGKSSPSSTSNLAISKDATSIFDELKGRHWPKGSKDDLLASIQISLNNLDQFRKLLRDASKEELKKKRLIDFRDEIDDKVGYRISFIENWFTDINDRVQNWDDWSGNIKSMAFSVRSKEFHKMGKGWAENWCHDTNEWNKLLEAIGCE